MVLALTLRLVSTVAEVVLGAAVEAETGAVLDAVGVGEALCCCLLATPVVTAGMADDEPKLRIAMGLQSLLLDG
ncbi:MAG: hypothetical protein RLY58_1904 [Pseudomonadota bacterium]|jgi:hypothetical protein